jgi:hypothetical protein
VLPSPPRIAEESPRCICGGVTHIMRWRKVAAAVGESLADAPTHLETRPCTLSLAFFRGSFLPVTALVSCAFVAVTATARADPLPLRPSGSVGAEVQEAPGPRIGDAERLLREIDRWAIEGSK